MDKAKDPSHEGEKPTTPPSDYRALIRVTRPLMIVKDAEPPPGLPIYRDQAIWAHTLDSDPESVLKRGEILPIELPGPATTADAEPPPTAGDPAARSEPEAEQGGTDDWDSDLTLRIYLGMS